MLTKLQWLTSSGLFALGAIVTGVAAELARRYFERPRLQISVADLTLTRTRDRFHNILQMQPELRRLVADWRVRDLDWSKTFYCEDDLDVGLLDTFHTEALLARSSTEFSRLLQLLPNVDIGEYVFQLACDKILLNVLRNGLFRFRERLPKQMPEAGTPMFATFIRTMEHEGRECHYVHLDLVGNAAPIVGDESGDEYLNERLAPLIYALSHGDRDFLAKILNIGKEYADLARQKYRAIRDDLVKVKDEVSYLAAEVVVTNIGKEPALLSHHARITLGKNRTTVELSYLESDEPRPNEKRSTSVALRAEVVRIKQALGVQSTLLDRYDSPLSQLVIQPAESRTIKFVSVQPLANDNKNAVQAARTGHLDFRLELTQALTREISRFPMFARYRNRIRTSQRLVPRDSLERSA